MRWREMGRDGLRFAALAAALGCALVVTHMVWGWPAW